MPQEDALAQHGEMFVQFVFGLMQSGMMQLGKLMNPMTKTLDKDLPGAQSTISLLLMLREKTRGNLSKTESDLLNSAISSLQLNYVDEVEAAGKAAPDAPASEAGNATDAKTS